VNRRELLGLVGFLVLCYGAASIGSRFTPGAWYAGLAKPSWTPPGVLFAPVWTVLYGLMAVAGWLVWKAGATARTRAALALFAAQLVLNTAWSWLFFGLERTDLALLCIVLLWAAILATTLGFRRVRPLAAALLLPYLLWVSFAAALNFEIWRLN
jgi:tryptophan-rich sensory protein